MEEEIRIYRHWKPVYQKPRQYAVVYLVTAITGLIIGIALLNNLVP